MTDEVIDCRSPVGLAIGLVDAVIACCRALASHDLTPGPVVEALRDAASDAEVQRVISSMQSSLEPVFCDKADDSFVSFGDVSHGRLGQQSQYASRYIDGVLEGWPCLGYGLRFCGSTNMYHNLKIHKDDVDEFVRRVEQYRLNNF